MKVVQVVRKVVQVVRKIIIRQTEHSGKRKKMIKWHFLCSIRCLAAISICFLMLRITC